MAIVEDNGKKMYRLNIRRLPGRQHEQAGDVHGSKCARYLSRFTKRKEARFRMDGIFIARSSVCTCSVVLATIEVINRDGRPRPLRIAPALPSCPQFFALLDSNPSPRVQAGSLAGRCRFRPQRRDGPVVSSTCRRCHDCDHQRRKLP